MTTLKQELENILIFENPYTKPITKAVIAWLQQKQTIPKILCNQLCHTACKICLLDDALSKHELLEELEQ